MKALTKFATKTTRVIVESKTWLVNGHYRNETGEIKRVTAAYLTESQTARPRIAEVADPVTVRGLCFEQRPRVARTIDVRALRRALGAPTWSRRTWRPILRKILGAVFDLVLVRRALACAPRRGLASLEIVPFGSEYGMHGEALRLIGDKWRVIVAPRTEAKARPLALSAAVRSSHEVSAGEGVNSDG